MPSLDQPRLLQQAEMFGHDRLRDTRPRRQVANGFLPFPAKTLEDRPTGGIGKSPEDPGGVGGHVQSISYWLWIDK
jgi:hypothetical protein